MAVEGKVIITCAITGAIHTPTMSPHLPITPDEITSAAIAAAEAGAAILHLHARNPETGQPDQTPEAFGRFLPRIKQGTTAAINITTGGSPFMKVEERVRPAATFKRHPGLLPQLRFHARVSGREMKYGHLFYLCRPGQLTGLSGCEMVLSLGYLSVLVHKYSFNKKVIGSFDQSHNSLAVGLAVLYISDITYFLTRCDPRNFIGQRSQNEVFRRLLGGNVYFKFRRRISLIVQCLLEFR